MRWSSKQQLAGLFLLQKETLHPPGLLCICGLTEVSALFLARSLDQNLSDFVLIFLEIMKQVQGIDHNPISFVDISEPEERKTFKIKK